MHDSRMDPIMDTSLAYFQNQQITLLDIDQELDQGEQQEKRIWCGLCE